MKVFKYKFTKVVTVLIYVGIALCAVCVGINIFSIVTSDLASSANIIYPIIQYVLMFLVPIVLAVLLVSLLISSYYSVDEKFFITSFGIIKSKYDVNEIGKIILDRASNKLLVFFKNENYIAVVVKEEWYDDFVNALLAANRNIEYSINSKENYKDDGNNEKKD